MLSRIKIIIVDDHQIFRDGIKSLFIGDTGIEFINEAGSAQELYEKIKLQTPDILLVDVDLPKISGFEITKKIKENYPDVKIIILSADKSDFSITSAIKAGALGYLHKDTTKEEIISAVNKAMEGKFFFGSSVTGSVFRGYANKLRGDQGNIVDASNSLTEREIEIIKLISEGLTYKEIGAKLFISKRTVETHKNNILKKLNISTIPELIKFAIRQNYINP